MLGPIVCSINCKTSTAMSFTTWELGSFRFLTSDLFFLELTYSKNVSVQTVSSTLRGTSQCDVILLGFPKDDPLSDHLLQAAEKLGYDCTVCTCPEDLLELYVRNGHDIVVLDNRNVKHLDAVAVCR
ncbi:hypothetical protein RUM43_003885 [Polyplax serrata]|uniref:PDE8-like REC N-terminal domain-containing protein n=1 Tax=Polyplax serrata TaxID=468196 RepID=A0AAN8PFF5_POLSC